MTTELYWPLAVREDGFGTYRARREEDKTLTALDGQRVLRMLMRCGLRGG